MLSGNMTLGAYSSTQMTDEERRTHLGFMRDAIAMAQLAFDYSETPVGCVLVYDNRIISRGINDTNRSFNGTRHAEFVALENFLSDKNICIANSDSSSNNGSLKDNSFYQWQDGGYSPEILNHCTLYVTVEPCIMCASLLRQIGIKRVFFGAWNEKFGGMGGVLDVHKISGLGKDVNDMKGDYEVSGGWMREEAILLLRRFYVQENERAPEPRDKSKRILKETIDIIK